MSNWLKAQCKTIENVEAKYMDDAFKRMGMYADFDTKTVTRKYDDTTRPCQALLRNISDGSSAHIGLNFEVYKKDGKQMVRMVAQADFWETEYTEKSFMEQFFIEYAAVKAIASAREQGFAVREEVTLEDGRRRLILARAA